MEHTAIPTYGITIEPKDLKVLIADVWKDDPVPAKLIVDNIPHEIGISYRGDHTRNFQKKSYSIDFRSYKEEFAGREIHLNAEYRDPSLIRNKLSFDFFQSIGSTAPNSKHVFLELNGEIKGIYLELESVDEFFLQRRELPSSPIFYATIYHANFSLLTPKGNPKPSLMSGYFQKMGTDKDKQDLEKFIVKINTTNREQFGEAIIKDLDIENYLLWLCGAVCTQNYDGFIHNYSIIRNEESKLYQVIPWDYDATWGRNWNGKIMEYYAVPIEGYNTLTARLLDVTEIRQQYRRIMEEILETKFTVKAIEPMVANLHTQLKSYISLDPFKKKSIALFNSEPEFILRFIEKRNSYLRKHLKDLS
ncbi:Inner spore coat protein H [Paenibacillus allorhizoplanae]|uniref:Inner spore coat protein H n=1 Tax=Paenibacillus allorhizoplanae TaxID=2905648 RepID=A0ABN8H079_9BACL|nr:CotH kinase family protein [Paenibacillus allorhizoplanae]CAH1222666.1 Inner spore coat protein H [Paenibacillus allorhizoplanae]